MTAGPHASAAVVACRAEDVPEQGCIAVLDNAVLLARSGGELVAYRNQCLHRQARLDDGMVDNGYLTCAQHFWRYRLSDGRVVGSDAALEPVSLSVVDGDVHLVPPPSPPASIRELLLEHARTWSREGSSP